MFSTFDLCLLLYVLRLAGWLKHCKTLVWGVFERVREPLEGTVRPHSLGGHQAASASKR